MALNFWSKITGGNTQQTQQTQKKSAPAAAQASSASPRVSLFDDDEFEGPSSSTRYGAHMVNSSGQFVARTDSGPINRKR